MTTNPTLEDWLTATNGPRSGFRVTRDDNQNDGAIKVKSLHKRAQECLANGELTRAIELLELAAKNGEESEHKSLAIFQYDIAQAYLANDQPARAIELLELVVKNGEESKHKSLPVFQAGLAQAYRANDQPTRAIEQFELAVKNGEESKHKSLPLFQYDLAQAYRASGKLAQAIKLYELAAVGGGTMWAIDSPKRLALQEDLAQAYEADDQLGKAVETLMQLALVYQTTSKPDEETSALRRAKAISEWMGRDHPLLKKVLCALTQARRRNGDDGRAIDLAVSLQTRIDGERSASGISRDIWQELMDFDTKFVTEDLEDNSSSLEDIWSMVNNP